MGEGLWVVYDARHVAVHEVSCEQQALDPISGGREFGGMSIYKHPKSGVYFADVTVEKIRHRASLGTKKWQDALRLHKEFEARVVSGKQPGTAPRGSFADVEFSKAVEEYIQGRIGRVAARTSQIDRERSKPLVEFFKDRPLRRIRANDISDYQRHRLSTGKSGRTINMEVNVLRGMLKRAKRWTLIADDVHSLPEHHSEVGRALAVHDKVRLFETAASREEWMAAYCAAVIAVNTTCRGIEIRSLRWKDLDLARGVIYIRRSKTEAGHRLIPLNEESLAAVSVLRQRAELLGDADSDHFVFPACEHNGFDFTKHQKSWRTAWRSLTKAAGLKGFRFHDLRHQAITELAEAGASDATLQALAGHLSRRMMEHYSHVRMEAKKAAVAHLGTGTALASKPHERRKRGQQQSPKKRRPHATP
jgi:integrase